MGPHKEHEEITEPHRSLACMAAETRSMAFMATRGQECFAWPHRPGGEPSGTIGAEHGTIRPRPGSVEHCTWPRPTSSAHRCPNILTFLREESASHPTLRFLVKGKCPKLNVHSFWEIYFSRSSRRANLVDDLPLALLHGLLLALHFM